MPKVEEPEGSIQMSARVDSSMVDRADSLIAHVTTKRGLTSKRADVWREALIIGLRMLEQERDLAELQEGKPGKRRKA